LIDEGRVENNIFFIQGMAKIDRRKEKGWSE